MKTYLYSCFMLLTIIDFVSYISTRKFSINFTLCDGNGMKTSVAKAPFLPINKHNAILIIAVVEAFNIKGIIYS